MNQPNPNRHRRGTSLIECLTIIAAGAMLTGVVVSGMASLMRYDRHTNQRTVERNQLHQFAATLRNDLHGASACRFDPDSQSLTLTGDKGETLEYRWHAKTCERIVQQPNTTAQTTRMRLPAALKFTCDPVDAHSGDLVRLRITNRATLEKSETNTPAIRQTPPWDLEIVATVGR